MAQRWGELERGERNLPSRRNRGFTLFELLVAVAIIAIFVGSVTLTVGSDRRGDELATEAHRFAALLGMASDEAVLRSQEWGLELDEKGYRFTALEDRGDETGWRLVDDTVFRARKLQSGTQADLVLEGRELDLASNDTADEEDKGRKPPPVLILSSGEITPFTATFRAEHTERRFRVSADLLGRVEFKELGEDRS